MAKEMLINVSEGEECRIALLEDGKLDELHMERTSSTSHVGNIYKGRVTNVEPSIQAAFVDFGLGRNGFLHISDLMPSYFGRAGNDIQESVGKKMARRDRPPIQRCLRRGDEIVVFLSGRAPAMPALYGLSQGAYRVVRSSEGAVVTPAARAAAAAKAWPSSAPARWST